MAEKSVRCMEAEESRAWFKGEARSSSPASTWWVAPVAGAGGGKHAAGMGLEAAGLEGREAGGEKPVILDTAGEIIGGIYGPRKGPCPEGFELGLRGRMRFRGLGDFLWGWVGVRWEEPHRGNGFLIAIYLIPPIQRSYFHPRKVLRNTVIAKHNTPPRKYIWIVSKGQKWSSTPEFSENIRASTCCLDKIARTPRDPLVTPYHLLLQSSEPSWSISCLLFWRRTCRPVPD